LAAALADDEGGANPNEDWDEEGAAAKGFAGAGAAPNGPPPEGAAKGLDGAGAPNAPALGAKGFAGAAAPGGGEGVAVASGVRRLRLVGEGRVASPVQAEEVVIGPYGAE
jgi:hypothetical protein